MNSVLCKAKYIVNLTYKKYLILDFYVYIYIFIYLFYFFNETDIKHIDLEKNFYVVIPQKILICCM